jgi:hypothetical protein
MIYIIQNINSIHKSSKIRYNHLSNVFFLTIPLLSDEKLELLFFSLILFFLSYSTNILAEEVKDWSIFLKISLREIKENGFILYVFSSCAIIETISDK